MMTSLGDDPERGSARAGNTKQDKPTRRPTINHFYMQPGLRSLRGDLMKRPRDCLCAGKPARAFISPQPSLIG